MSFRINIRGLSFLIIILYIAYVNVFIFSATFEILLIEFFILILLYWRTRKLEFVKDFTLFVALFVLYEYIRGNVDNSAPFGESTYYFVYQLENSIFSVLPTVFLQRNFAGFQLINYISSLGYASFFFYSFLVGFIYWVRDKKVFWVYIWNFLFLSYVSLVFFWLIPTAPPWYVDEHNTFLSINRYIYNNNFFDNIRSLSIYRYFILGNQVAAFPSLHVGWVAYTSFFIIEHSKTKWSWVTLILPLLVGFSVVIYGEHWLLDVLGGCCFAYIFVRYDVRLIFRRLVNAVITIT